MNKSLSIIFLGILFLGVTAQANDTVQDNAKVGESSSKTKINTDDENMKDLLDTIEDTIPDIPETKDLQ